MLADGLHKPLVNPENGRSRVNGLGDTGRDPPAGRLLEHAPEALGLYRHFNDTTVRQ